MNNKKFNIIIFLLLLFTIILMPKIVAAEEENDTNKNYYVYPVTPNDPEWAQLPDVQSRIDICRIPKEIVDRMSDQELIQAVLDFPFLTNIMTSSNTTNTINHLSTISDAYKELLTRKNAKNEMIIKVESLIISKLNKKSKTLLEKANEIVLPTLILNESSFKTDLTLQDLNILNEFTGNLLLNTSETQNKIYPKISIKTPNGSTVNVSISSEIHTVIEHQDLDAYYVSLYPGITLIRNGSCLYNCHSYAWYSQDFSNQYWIDYPDIYMTDGSYNKVFSGNISSNSVSINKNDLIYYKNTHTAICDDNISGAPIATKYMLSKWGTLGVFRHTGANVPSSYNTDEISVWHR